MSGKKIEVEDEIEDEEEDSIEHNSKTSDRSRAKKNTKDETEALVRICNQYHAVINKNSNTDADRKAKAATWITIKENFNAYCQSEGIYVCFLVCFCISLHLFHFKFEPIFFVHLIKVNDRTITQLQNKYKDLKKNARQLVSNAKHDLAQTV